MRLFLQYQKDLGFFLLFFLLFDEKTDYMTRWKV